MDQPHVISANGLFEGERKDLGRSAVVIDDTGHYEAVAVADHLISAGLKVSFVTRHYSFAPRCDPFLVNEAALQRLNRGDFRFLPRMRATTIGKDSVVVAPTYSSTDSNATETLPADTVVVVSLNRPNRDLYDALKAQRVPVSVAGDASMPRFLSWATMQGHTAAASV
jgi:hypothetical protein